jgi:aryl-phospho-beta-D-glucosidase BglC (GH1 family)
VKRLVRLLAVFVGLLMTSSLPTVLCASAVPFAGVNLAGAEFGAGSLPGTYGVDTIYPTAGEVDYFHGKGMNAFRLPFRWERLQHAQFEDLDLEELARLDGFVDYATGRGAFVILDPHNFARYYGDHLSDAMTSVLRVKKAPTRTVYPALAGSLIRSGG